jgi:hypothetical protein
MACIVFHEVIQADSLLEDWDSFVDSSINGTIFHKIGFLNYHDLEFKKKLRYFEFKLKNYVVARLVIGIDNETLYTPFGASYGGFIFNEYPSYTISKELVDCLLEIAKTYDLKRIHYTPPIQGAHESSLDTFYFALMERGFNIISADVTNVFDQKFKKYSTRLHRARQRAIDRKVVIEQQGKLEDFWNVLEKTFDKHGAIPTHTFNEFKYLTDRPDLNIRTPVAYFQDRPVAALGCIRISKHLDSSFYICSDPSYRDTQALTYLLYETLNAVDESVRYFSFGTSTHEMIPRKNIFEFKENFSRIGMFRFNFVKELT